MLLSASGRTAEHDWPRSPRANDTEQRVSLSLSQRAGLVEAPFVTTAFPEVSGFGMILTGSAAATLSPIGWLRLKLPIALVWLDFPAGSQEKEAALGNLELALEHPVELHPATRLGLLASLFVPSAEHGSESALLNNRALSLGSALNGGKDAALLTPGVTGLRLAVSIEQTLSPFELRARIDVPLLVRVSSASLPDDTETHPIGILPTVDVTAAAWITRWFAASLGGGLISEPLRVEEPARERDRRRRLQGVVELGIHLRLGEHLALGLDASIPVGGRLGGEAWSIGTQARFALP
jgi:hypothetical protein